MCGIAGQLRHDGQPVSEKRLRFMASALAHRGPDGEGIWSDGAVGLAHRRLSLVDLSSTGAQPMLHASGKFAITFNGEIYNYQELRRELEAQGVAFRGTSDTEVVLDLFVRDGEKVLEKLRGMFAFAIWDADRRVLFFARDRIGKKPFYYQQTEQTFIFASEIKALVGEEKFQIDWEAVRLFVGLQYVPSPKSGFVGIASLPPGYCGWVQDGQVAIKKYSTFERQPKFTGSFDEAAREVRRLLEESVRLRMIADVPVGTFLSGGMDSTAIAALMARASSGPIQTFTMGFPSFGFDERAEARSFAQKIQADHHEFEVKPADALRLVDLVISHYDAPYADSSALPTWLLAHETKPLVKAAMAGDGGDELFGGYRRYQYYLLAQRLKRLGLSNVGSVLSDVACRVLHDSRFLRFARLIRANKGTMAEAYASLFTGSYFTGEDEGELLASDFERETRGSAANQFVVDRFKQELGAEGMLDFDLTSYLPDDLNVKMDRATMAHGLEVRCPLLDQELVKFAVRLPLKYLLKYGKQKPLLKAALADVVPPEIWTRPKRGFEVPLTRWFRDDLRQAFIERCLVKESPLSRICQPQTVRRYFDENDRGRDHGYRLWMLYVLATWLQCYG